MAGINPYRPDLTSRVVGTPGEDQSAGRAQAQLSQGVNSLAGEVGELANSNGADILGALVKGGFDLLSHKIRADRVAKAEQRKQLADLGVTNSGHQFAQSADSVLKQMKENHINDPENIEDDLKKQLEFEKKQKLAGIKDPLQQAKAASIMDGHITSILDKAGNWSLERQVGQAKALVPNMVKGSQDNIAAQTGTIAERVVNFQDQVKLLTGSIQQTEPQLGQLYVDAAKKEAIRDLSDSQFQNLITQRPEEPLAAISHLTEASTLLKGSVQSGFTLTTEDQEKFSKRIEAAKATELKSLDLTYSQHTSAFLFDAAKDNTNLHIQAENPEINQSMLDWADGQRQNIAQIIAGHNNDPSLPAEVKDLLRGQYMQQMKAVDTIALTARANLRYQEGLRKAAEAEQRRLKAEDERERNRLRIEKTRLENEARRDLNEFKKSQREAAAAALKMGEREAKIAINSKLEEMQLADPVKDQAKLVQNFTELNRIMADAQNAGFIDPDYVSARRQKAREIAEGALALDTKLKGLPWSMKPETVKLSPKKDADKIYQKKQDFKAQVDAIQQAQSSMKQDQKADAYRKQLKKGVQQTEFDKWLPQIMDNPGISEAEKPARLNALVARISKDLP